MSLALRFTDSEGHPRPLIENVSPIPVKKTCGGMNDCGAPLFLL
jgi:hypothetical protein